MSKKFLDADGLLYVWTKIKAVFVPKVEGKGLSTNDYTDAEKAALAGKLDKSGGTMAGKLTLDGEPTADLHAATKKYVDDSVTNAGGGDMLKAVYDKDGDGVVDDAQKVNGHTVAANVPADAKFTDTTYISATSEADGLMSKADYVKLAGFGSADTYALKSDITSMYKYKGSKANYAALPAEGNAVGDVWNVEDTGMNYAWTGETWDALGAAFEVESITNAEIDTIVAS